MIRNRNPNNNNSQQKLISKGVLSVNEIGNGFVNLHSENRTVYVHKSNLSRAFNLEEVEVEYTSNEDNTYSGKIINYSLLNKEFVGLVHHCNSNGNGNTIAYIYVSELKIHNLISVKTSIPLAPNNWVKVKIIRDDTQLFGMLLSILPDYINSVLEEKYNLTHLPNTDIDTNIDIYDVYNDTPNDIPNDNNTLTDILTENEKDNIDYIDYIDQTNLFTFTIDPPNSLDCDDAFSIQIISDTEAKIFVHISNVAHYFNPVNCDKNLWNEILNRGTTIYGMYGENWDMIPPNYANYICSILPNKLTHVITCEFSYTHSDTRVASSNHNLVFNGFYCSKIISKIKYDYDTFDTILDNAKVNALDTLDTQSRYYPYNILKQTAEIIKEDFNDFIFGNETPAHWIVRYWMIKVNLVMCRDIYRFNAEPSINKFTLLTDYINFKYGNDNTIANSNSNIYSERENVIKAIKDNPQDKILMYLGKTALNKSKYTTDANCNTHYGIGQMNYTHWTSPIRRLPDLLNHCKLLGYSFTNTELNQYLNNMNKMEKKQDTIEKFIDSWVRCHKIKIDDLITGIIINVKPNGVAIYIDSIDYKCMLHISKLSPQYRLTYLNEKLTNTEANISFAKFDTLQLKITNIFFDIIEFSVIGKI